MKFNHKLSKLTAICLSAALAVLCGTAYASEKSIPIKYKSFSDVFSESIDTNISDIAYGIICYPSAGVNRAAELEKDDLTTLMDAYNKSEGICVLASINEDFDSLSEIPDTQYPYFYIGVSSAMPSERYTHNSSDIKMARLCFGGSYGGASVYGGYGIVESSYGKEYQNSIPVNFVWYKPIGSNSANITEIANAIYNKYKDKAKPFGDYDGTNDDKYFSGIDAVYNTLTRLPECFSANGCSGWAYSYLHQAAEQNLIPYNTSRMYSSPLTRRECCELIANMLNTVIGNYYDLFAYPNSYAALSEKAKALGSDLENIKYSDISDDDKSIKILSAIGIVNGTDAGTFDPNGYITREQICTVLGRVLEVYPEFYNYISDFADNTDTIYGDDNAISPWAYDYVYSMSKYGFVNGTGNNMFSPRELCTLEQIITVILRFSDALPRYSSK